MPTETFGELASSSAFFFLAFAALTRAPVAAVMNPHVARRRSASGRLTSYFRADAFRVGGFERLAMSIDDDLRLGQALKFAGYRAAVALGQGAVSVRWQVGLWGMVRGLEKNFFAGADFRLWPVPLGVLIIVTLGVLPHVGVFVGPWWARCVCASGVAATALILGFGRGQNGVHWYHASNGAARGGPGVRPSPLIRSVTITLRHGGVRWRDHHYPLRELKDHVRARNAWVRELWRSTATMRVSWRRRSTEEVIEVMLEPVQGRLPEVVGCQRGGGGLRLVEEVAQVPVTAAPGIAAAAVMLRKPRRETGGLIRSP